MANLSPLTRKQQVLQYLKDRANQWVDGPEIANETVGGSEGHKRWRELRDEGYPVENRRHPSPRRDIWQYRYVSSARTNGLEPMKIWNPTQKDLVTTEETADDWVQLMLRDE